MLLDKEFEAKLKIIKQDDETKKAVLQKNTEFKTCPPAILLCRTSLALQQTGSILHVPV